MKYISIGIIMLISFIISVVITKVEIPVLKRKAGQNIREDGPQSHLSKAGTPSMEGSRSSLPHPLLRSAQRLWERSMALDVPSYSWYL